MFANKYFWLIAVLTTILSACVGSGQRPQWIDNPQASYPAATHLSAVGSADDQQTAADRATANLAKIFEVTVSDSSQDFSSAQTLSANGQSQTSNEQKVSRQLNLETRKIVAGAKVAEYWQAEDGRVYALAVLDKNAAASRLRAAILSADRDVDQLISYASHTADTPVAALHAIKRAREQQRQRDALNRDLMIVADGHGIDSRYDLPAVEKLLRDALAQLKISVRTEDASIQAELQRALAQLGVQVVEQSNLVLTGSLDTAPVESREGWYWQRGSYELIFKDGTNVLAKQRWPIKASSTEPGLLDSRVRDEINRLLPDQLFELLSTEP